ncbi:MAG: hypothetical protein ACLFO2_01580 [Candidatus Woesearchaeota archaeon]
MTSRTLLLGFLCLLFALPFASAWGVAPSRQLADFEVSPQSLSVDIVNERSEDKYFSVSFKGELAEHASYDGDPVHVTPGDDRVEVPFTLDLPEGLEPGEHHLSVVLEEQLLEGEGTVSSRLSLAAGVVVRVPRRGQHAQARLSVGQASQDESVPFTVSVLNTGGETVPVWADVTVLNPMNDVLEIWHTGESVFAPGESGKIETSWSGDKRPGLYTAEVVVHYGDETKVLRRQFSVGAAEVVVEEVSSDEFSLGDISPLDISLYNRWNRPVEDVYAEVFVLSDGRIVQSFKTPSEDVAPFGRATLRGFWDTSDLVVGEYDLQVDVAAGKGSVEESFPVVVKMDRLDVRGGPTGQVSSDTSSSSDSNSLLVALMVVVVITNVVLVVWLRRSRE